MIPRCGLRYSIAAHARSFDNLHRQAAENSVGDDTVVRTTATGYDADSEVSIGD